MVALNNLRSRLRAVENIKKITTSMEMVASARLRKAQIKAKKAQYYIAKTREVLERLERSSSDYQHPLFQKKVVNKMGVVIVSSDRGLCGAYNTRVFSEADQFLQKHPHENIELILLGRKASFYYRKKKWRIRSEKVGWSGKMTFPEIKEFSNQLIDFFLSGELDAIWLVYTQFHNLMDRKIACERFLPLGIDRHEIEKKSLLNYIFEPNLDEVYLHILFRYCMNKIETVLDQSYASELAARIFAMKAAANNAAEMEETLTLERNKVRQAQITREILETISSMGE